MNTASQIIENNKEGWDDFIWNVKELDIESIYEETKDTEGGKIVLSWGEAIYRGMYDYKIDDKVNNDIFTSLYCFTLGIIYMKGIELLEQLG